MIGWIAGKLTTPMLYALLGILVVALAFAAGKAVLLAHDKGELQTQLDRAHADNAQLNLVVTQARAERDSLASAVAAQNAAIRQLASDSETANARARESAAQVARRHAERKRVIPAEVNADEVNAEIRARFEEAAR